MAGKFYFGAFFLFLSTFAFAQNATLKGQITDINTHALLTGAVIHFDDHKNEVSTNVGVENIHYQTSLQENIRLKSNSLVIMNTKRILRSALVR